LFESKKGASIEPLRGERVYGRENNYGIAMQGKSNHGKGQMSRERSEQQNAWLVVSETGLRQETFGAVYVNVTRPVH
jgi:hypothetical protein